MKNQEVNALRVSRGKRIYIVHFLVLLYKTCLARYVFRVQSKRGANEDDAGKVVDIFIEFPPPPLDSEEEASQFVSSNRI